eukprot:Opistho-2@318
MSSSFGLGSEWDWGSEQETQGPSYGGYGGGGDDNAEDDAAAEEMQTKYASKDSVIFVVDASKDMFVPMEDGSIPFQLALKCIKNTFEAKIIASDSDYLGVIFYGTRETKNPTNLKNIYVFQDLDRPGASQIMALEGLTAGDKKKFEKDIGHAPADTAPFGDALWQCVSLFSNSLQKVGMKRVFVFTNDDEPAGSTESGRAQAFQRSRDLGVIGAQIELMHMSKPGRKFDSDKFFRELVYGDEDEGQPMPDPAETFEGLMDRMRRKQFKKRSLMKIPLFIGDGVEIGVSVYNLVGDTKKGTPKWLDKRTNEAVKTVSQQICQDTGALLLPDDVKHGVIFGGERIIFSKADALSMRTLGRPGLVLMGFKPRDRLKRWHNVKVNSFCYPDETVIRGSSLVFKAILIKCAELGKVAICRFIPRQAAPPRFVALLPQVEVKDAQGIQLQAPGFHIIQLPYADDVRQSLQFEGERSEIGTDEIEKAKAFINSLSFEFNSLDLENPALQMHYRNLEALALNRDMPEGVVDSIEPATDKMDEAAGAEMRAFIDVVYPEGYEPGKGAKPAARKRPAAAKKDDGDAPPAKAAKVEVGDDVKAEVLAHAAKGTLAKLTVPVLKAFLTSSGVKVPSSAKKGDLVEMAENFCKK